MTRPEPTSDELRQALSKAMRDAFRPFGGRLRSVQKIAAYLPITVQSEPSAEERARWAAAAVEADRMFAERLWSHPQRVAAASSPLREVLELHAPVTLDGSYPRAECHGEDLNGYDAEPPSWPCRTYRLIAGWSE